MYEYYEWCFYTALNKGNGGMGRDFKKFYSLLAEMIATKQKQEYCITMSWLNDCWLTLLSICAGRGKNLNQEEI